MPTLQAALAAEHAACYAYGIVGAHLTGARLAAARRNWVAHQRARDRLEAMLRGLGATPTAAAVAYQLPGPVRSGPAAERLAGLVEDRVATAYLGLVALSTPALRRMGALGVRACALRAAFWTGRTSPFPGMSPAALVRQRAAAPG